MKGRFIALAAVLFFIGRSGAEPLRLMWCNGDSLPGAIESLEGNTLNWRSPLFGGSLQVDAGSLRSIAFPPEVGLVEVDEPFRIDTASGDILYGKLTGIDDLTVTVQSLRHGTVALKRDEIVSLRRLTSSAFIALGGLAGWETLDPDRKVDAWRTGIRGRIETAGWYSELFRKLELPDLAEIELALSWQKAPGFVFSVMREEDVEHPESVTIETWGDEAVVIRGKQFEPVKQLSKSAGRLHLRIYLNRTTGDVTVCSYEGRQLAQITGNPSGAGGIRGIFLRNKRNDLSLETLRIANWNGQLPAPVSAGENRLHLIGGGLVYGAVKSYDAATQSLVVTHEGAEQALQIDKLDTLHFSGSPRPDSATDTEISFHDGAVIRGRLESLSGTEAKMRTAFANSPVASKLDGCREINWPSKDQNPPDRGDVLYWDGGRSHGEIAAVAGGEFPIGWKPIGSTFPVALEKAESIRLLRREVNTDADADPKFPDSIFLTDFTALPCRISQVDEVGAKVVTPFNDNPVNVENALLQAIEFRPPEPIKGFADGRWKASGDDTAVKVDANGAKFSKVGRLSHPSALAGSEVRFKLTVDQNTNAQLQLRLFAESIEAAANAAVRCSINCSATYMNVAGKDGRFMKSVRMGSPQAEFLITCVRNRLVVKVNQEIVLDEDLEEGRPGRGIDFAVNSIQNSQGKPEGSLRISDFSVGNAAGSTAFFVPNEVKDRVLTVPRLRKSSPPKHLLAAPNGDVLRGDLVTVDGEKVKFRSKLKDLEIQRSRVAGIVWFHDADAAQATSGSARVLLSRHRVLAIDPESLQENLLTGRSRVFGEARIPLDKIREIHLGGYVPPEAIAPYADWKLRPAKEPNAAFADP